VSFSAGFFEAMSDGESGSESDSFEFMCGLKGDDFADVTEDETVGIALPEPLPVERVDLRSITAEEFLSRFSAQSRPVVLTNAQAALPVHIDLQYLAERYCSMRVPLDINTKDALPVELGDFMAFTDKDLNRRYLRNLHIAEWFPAELPFRCAEHPGIQLPDVFGHNHLSDPEFSERLGFPKPWQNWFELFINTRDCAGFPFLHRDMCNTHAFSMQLSGIKRFLLYPPSDAPFLYPQGAASGRSRIPARQLEEPSVLADYPLLARASPSFVNLKAGELLFCPANHWHATRTMSAEPSLTIGGNYVDAANRADFEDAWADYSACMGTGLAKLV
jgi:hypothetical protein